MPVPTFNEGSGAEFTASFENVDGLPSAPVSVHWRLVDDETGNVVQDWTEVTAASNVTIEVSGSLVQLLDRSNTRESKTLLIVADKDLDNEYSEPYPFWVRRVGRY